MTANIDRFKKTWGETCHTMWIEILGVHALHGLIHGRYSEIPNNVKLTEIVYAPECRGRLNDITKDRFLERFHEYRSSAVSYRVVLLSSAFEDFARDFFLAYLQARKKYSAPSGELNDAGNEALDKINKRRGLVGKLEEFSKQTQAKLSGVKAALPVLDEVYALRNIIAHQAGVVEERQEPFLKISALREGQRVSLAPDFLTTVLAPPVIQIAEFLDAKSR